MTGNEHDAKNRQNPLFDHPEKNYRIMAQVIRQSEKAGFDAWHREKDQKIKSFAEYLLFFGPFTEEIFYHDFAARYFQNEKEKDYLTHLQKMVAYEKPFEYLEKFLIPVGQVKKSPTGNSFLAFSSGDVKTTHEAGPGHDGVDGL